MKKILVIRLSSFGDIVQSLSAVPLIRKQFQDCEISFLTKKEFSSIVELQSGVDEVISFDRKLGLKAFCKLCFELKKRRYDYVYDSHLSVRSLILKLIFWGPFFKLNSRLIERPKHRVKRFFLFNFGIDLFKEKFIARKSFTQPLEKEFNLEWENEVLKWNFPESTKLNQWFANNIDYSCLVLGANWDLKRWPQNYWSDLIKRYPKRHFVLLGAKLEEAVASELENQFSNQVTNFVSKLSLVESCLVLSRAQNFVSADTGLLHVADSLGVSGYSLMGPTAFGYITSDHIKVLEDLKLSCRPCSKDGRGNCSQKVYKQCMVNLSPEMIHL